jgi:uncharacterized coiled-coil protein SlyX
VEDNSWYSDPWKTILAGLTAISGIYHILLRRQKHHPKPDPPAPSNGSAMLHEYNALFRAEREAMAEERAAHRETCKRLEVLEQRLREREQMLNVKEKEVAALHVEMKQMAATCDRLTAELEDLRESAAG